MALRVVTPPSDTPVSLIEAKAHLRLEESADDAYVEQLIESAASHVAVTCERALMQQEVELISVSPWRSDGAVRLIGGALHNEADLVRVAYLDGNDVEHELPLTSCFLVPGGTATPAALFPKASWPTMSSRPDALRVRYRVGWATAAEVPAPLRHAVLLVVSQLYEFRTPEVTTSIATSGALEALLAPYRFPSI
ncbi:MAG: hypothetical protein DI536_28880 [Archangium gephyra]|uniref:PhiE125 gp8 family phage protein n=1 Tax=Archangium gephyra TaxID=48 RepID=A0A2W5T2H5_9BACT|nr:MAG: hypothetical protein DI536_28880 [Archangium gephyra]